MRIHFRKALALVLSLLMLCTLIPMGAMTSVSAADPVVSFDLNFNDGSVGGFSGGSNIAGGGPDGSNCFKWTATGGWSAIWKSASNVYENGTYVISFKAKASVAGEMSITIQDGSWADYYYKELFNTTTEWTDYEITTNVSDYPTSNGGILFKFQDQGTAMDLYIDDLKMYEYVEPEPETPAAGQNLVINGDFENSTNGWKLASSSSIVSGGYSGSAIQLNPGSSSWAELARQDIAVEAFETYTLTWRSKRVSGTGVFNMEIAKAPYDGSKPTITHVTNYTWMSDTSGNWVEHKTTIEMKDSNGNGISGIMIKLTNEATNPGVILIDDICLTKNLTASFDGYLYNGDFEVGTLDKWTAYNGSAASTAAKHSGAYGALIKSDGSWGGVMSQGTINVVAGKTYIVSYWIKVIKNSIGIQIKDGTTSSGSVLTSKTHGTGDWTQVTFEVKPTQNGLFINFHGSGGANADATLAAEAYVDDIKVELKGGNPQEKVAYVGSSVRDNDPKDNGSGKGLAFQFKVSAEGGTKGFDNKYQGNGKVELGDQKYTLVKMGAVMTNNATVGQNADNFNLGAVNGTKVIDIPAVYLCGATNDSLSFAVRICDIPDRHIGTSIYARPYYVYQEDGVEVTIYGEIRSGNYAKAANISTADKTKPIRILSIGHSFSKDVMTTNLYNMFVEGGYEDITIGYLYMAGCSMPKHLYNIQNNKAQYEYAKNNSGTWVTKYNVSALTALQEEEWDFVTVQSSPDYIGGQTINSFKEGVNNDGTQVSNVNMTEYEAMDQITDWIKANATNADVKIDYHMIWSFSEDCELWSYTYHDYDQMKMYTNIVNITQQKVQNHEDINRVIPSATAIQNVRSSFMGDNFNMPVVPGTGADGYHLNDYGDYVAALTWYCHYSGDNANIMAGYTGVLTTDEFLAVAEAVNNAIDIPYAVTESTHK